MKKRHTISSSLYTSAQFVVNTISLVFLYYEVLKFLGQHELGVWSMVTTLPTALTVFGSGVGGCILRHTPKHSTNMESRDFTKFFATGLLFNLLSASLIITLGFLFSDQILRFILSEKNVVQYKTIFFLALWNVFFKYVIVVVTTSLDGMQFFKARSLINIISSLLQIIFTIPAIYYFRLNGVLVLQLSQTLIILILSLIFIARTNLFNIYYFKPNWKYVKIILNEGKNFQLISLSVLFFEPVSKYFIKKYTNYDIVSMYDIAMRATTQLHSIINAGIQVIIPRVTELQALAKLNMVSFFLKANRLGILISSLMFSLLSYVAIKSSVIIGFNNNNLFNFYIATLSLAFLICAISIVPYSILLGIGNTKIVLFSHLISSVINALLFTLISNRENSFTIIIPPFCSIVISAIFLEVYYIIKYKASIKYFLNELLISFSYILFNILILVISIYNKFNFVTEIIEFFVLIYLVYVTLKTQPINEMYKSIANK